jgi:hypothetical protein
MFANLIPEEQRSRKSMPQLTIPWRSREFTSSCLGVLKKKLPSDTVKIFGLKPAHCLDLQVETWTLTRFQVETWHWLDFQVETWHSQYFQTSAWTLSRLTRSSYSSKCLDTVCKVLQVETRHWRRQSAWLGPDTGQYFMYITLTPD